MTDSHEANTPSRSRRTFFSFLMLFLAACVGLGAYCVQLNHLLYQKHAPFHDSMGYYGRVYNTMTITQAEGLQTGLVDSVQNTTVCAPYFIAALLSYVFEPSRAIGVWIQTGEVFLFLCILFYFLTSVRRIRPSISFSICMSLLCLDCIYFTHGGLSDFRMDLSLMLMYGSTCLLGLCAIKKPTWTHFALFGFVAGIACLFRATAPVYLVLAMGPLLLLATVLSDQKMRMALGTLASGLIATLVSGWFFISRFDFLHYYYVVWNTDANAKLSLSKSLDHFDFVQEHLGWSFLMFLIVVGFTLVILHYWNRSKDRGLGRIELSAMVYIALAPIGFLIARGAGLNPFVSMPTSIGLFILLATILAHLANEKWSVRRICFLNLVLVACIIGSASRGYFKHANPKVAEMDRHKQLLRWVIEDAKASGFDRVRVECQQLTDFNTSSLMSTLQFDMNCQPGEQGALVCDGIAFLPSARLYTLPAVADWKMVEGESDREKVLNLSNSANGWLDYLIVVDNPADRLFQKRFGKIVVNQKAASLRLELMRLGNWKQVGSTLKAEHGYLIRAFRNEGRQLVRRHLQENYVMDYRSNLKHRHNRFEQTADSNLRGELR